MTPDEEKKSFLKDMCEALKSIKQPKHDSQVDFRARAGNQMKFEYASLKEVLNCLKPLQEHGIFFNQNEVYDDGMWYMQTEISHVSGYSKIYKTFLKNNTTSEKDFASSITYSRRYSLCSIFGLYGQKDLDALPEMIYGNSPQVEEFISNNLQDELMKHSNDNLEFKKKLNQHLKATNIPTVNKIPKNKEGFYRGCLEKFKVSQKTPMKEVS